MNSLSPKVTEPAILNWLDTLVLEYELSREQSTATKSGIGLQAWHHA